MADGPVFTPAEAARVLKLPVKTVVELCRRGVIRATKLGRRWRILATDLLAVFER